jgi:shikimate kinase
MSNIGKSYWSRRLAAESGFERVACDMLIEQKLRPELTKHGYAGIRDVAKWMGQPFDPQYPETSAKYIACERAVMQETIESLNGAVIGKPFVIDTTGSVIYAGDDITAQLRALTRVVYFEASPAHISQLFHRYMNNPKPVIWGHAYAPQAGESPQDALKRCYAELLRGRAQRYRDFAHVRIPYEKHRAASANIMSLIGMN